MRRIVMQIVHFKWKCEFYPLFDCLPIAFSSDSLWPCLSQFFHFLSAAFCATPLSFLSFFTLFISLITLIYQNHQLQWFAVLPFYSHLSWLITMKFFVKSSYLLLFSSRCYLKRNKKRNSQMSLFIIGRIKYYICSFRLWTDSSELFVHSKHRGRSFHCIS